MAVPSAKHPSDKTLHRYILGKLADVSAESVGRHVEACGDCRGKVAAISSDNFLSRPRDAQAKPKAPKSRAVKSGSGADESAPPPARPAVKALPPGLAENPDYEVIRELGRGGVGVVYLVRNRLMGRDEVLKFMNREFMERPDVVERFLREIQAVAKLNHEHVVGAYSATRIGESLAFSMQYAEGRDLARTVKARGPLPVDLACKCIYQAALGLQHAHEKGLVHRYIKPSNLILARASDRLVVKILDFGLAKATQEAPRDRALTFSGQMLGTPDYVAPEQIRDAPSADIRADIYSLGCTFYYLLSGNPPFDLDNLYDLIQAQQSMEARPLDFVRPEVPPELAMLVAKMMAKDPDRRFQTPAEVAAALVVFSRNRGAGRAANPAQVGPAIATPQAPPIDAAVALAELQPRQPDATEVPWEALIITPADETMVKSSGNAGARRQRSPLLSPAACGLLVLVFGMIAYSRSGTNWMALVGGGPKVRPLTRIDADTKREFASGRPSETKPSASDLAVAKTPVALDAKKPSSSGKTAAKRARGVSLAKDGSAGVPAGEPTTSIAEAETPEQLLVKLGLTRVGALYVLDGDIEFQERLKLASQQVEKSLFARKQQAAIEFNKVKVQGLANEINRLVLEIKDRNTLMRRLPRITNFEKDDFNQVRDERDRLQFLLNEDEAAHRDLTINAPTPKQVQELAAEIRRGPMVLQELRYTAKKIDAKYADLAKDDELKDALRKLGKGATLQLGTSPEYTRALEQLTNLERRLGQAAKR